MDAIGSIGDILDFSFPEIIKDPLRHDPSRYKNFLVNSIKIFITFMVEYVNKNRSNPRLVKLIEAFFRRMAALWSFCSYRYFNSSNSNIADNSSWDNESIRPVSFSSEESDDNTTVINDGDFHMFSREFYKLITQQGDLHDLNQLISVVLLGGYENIYYYIDKPTVIIPPQLAVKNAYGAARIVKRSENDNIDNNIFSQLGHKSYQTITNMPIIPLFVRLAAFIVRNPTQLSHLNDTAIEQAVDRAVSEATAKLEAKKAVEEAASAAAKEQERKKIIHDNWVRATTGRLTGTAALEEARKTFNETENQGAAGFMEKQPSPSSVRGVSQSVIAGNTVTRFGGKRRKRSSCNKRNNKKRSNKRSGKRSGHNKRIVHKSRRR